MSRHDDIINLTVHVGWEIQLSDGILRLLGLDDGLGGHWLQQGTSRGDPFPFYRFQAEGRRKRPDRGLACCVYFVLSVVLSSGVLLYLV